jgi:hypothetical protein
MEGVKYGDWVDLQLVKEAVDRKAVRLHLIKEEDREAEKRSRQIKN